MADLRGTRKSTSHCLAGRCATPVPSGHRLAGRRATPAPSGHRLAERRATRKSMRHRASCGLLHAQGWLCPGVEARAGLGEGSTGESLLRGIKRQRARVFFVDFSPAALRRHSRGRSIPRARPRRPLGLSFWSGTCFRIKPPSRGDLDVLRTSRLSRWPPATPEPRRRPRCRWWPSPGP